MTKYERDTQMLLQLNESLADVSADFVWIEGAALRLYADGMDSDRPEKEDYDLQLATATDIEEFAPELGKIGYEEVLNRNTTRRYKFRDFTVEVVHYKAISWVPTMVWLKKGLEEPAQVNKWDSSFQVVSFNHFLANKFSTYSSRDVVGPRKSHEFTVVAYLIKNRISWVEEIASEKDPSLKLFLLNALVEIKNNFRLQTAILEEYGGDNASLALTLEKIDKLLF